ncbi:uncharacterized protein LOC130642337 [Hydractinia symbiolongicarpus]|uniref:uncharacterized protein LOC130642337 n=1 Tax=Hydractinia symbiolongicarpus TaxID=13093 RepID=UPI00254B4932|nr:uncharacterized protein LOC130642337 [Hydractinia symbiolongicarpus]
MLLLHTSGATSFEDLRTVNGNIAETFRNAGCKRTKYKDEIYEDYIRRMNEEQAEYRLLQDINSVLRQFGKSLADYNLPHLDVLPPAENIDIAIEAERASQLRAQLTYEQTALANAVIEAVVNVANTTAQNNRLFYLKGAGGSSKIFNFNYLMSKLTGRGFQVGTPAFTDIATLLKKGTIIHRLFRLPVSIVGKSTCSITPVSAYAAELRRKNRLLQDICNNELPFGGKVVLLGGDFSQLLPVVRKGKSTEIVDMCLKSSPLWHLFKEFRLHRNMRTRPGEQQFAASLLQVGKGVLPVREQEPFQGAIKVPSQCVIEYECIVETLFRDFYRKLWHYLWY